MIGWTKTSASLRTGDFGVSLVVPNDTYEKDSVEEDYDGNDSEGDCEEQDSGTAASDVRRVIGATLFVRGAKPRASYGKLAFGALYVSTKMADSRHFDPSLDQKQEQEPRPRDTSDQEGQPVALRDEGAYRVDVASGVVHTVTGTAANEADINQMAAVLHGREEAVFADAGYTGADKRPEHEDREVSWNNRDRDQAQYHQGVA